MCEVWKIESSGTHLSAHNEANLTLDQLSHHSDLLLSLLQSKDDKIPHLDLHVSSGMQAV